MQRQNTWLVAGLLICAAAILTVVDRGPNDDLGGAPVGTNLRDRQPIHTDSESRPASSVGLSSTIHDAERLELSRQNNELEVVLNPTEAENTSSAQEPPLSTQLAQAIVSDTETVATRQLILDLKEQRSRLRADLALLTGSAYNAAFDRGEFVVADEFPSTRGKLMAVRHVDDKKQVVNLPRAGNEAAYALLDQVTRIEDDIASIVNGLNSRLHLRR